MRRITVTKTMLQDFAVRKIGWLEISHTIDKVDPDDVVCNEYVKFTLDDIRDVFSRCLEENTTVAEFYVDWWDPFISYFYENFCLNDLFGDDPMSIRALRLKELPETDSELLMWIIWHIFKSYEDLSTDDEPVDSLEELLGVNDILTMIDWHYEDGDLPFWKRQYIDRIKLDFILEYDNDLILQDTGDDIRETFIRFTDEMAAKEHFTALRIKAYACYGGNSVYKCDLPEAIACLEKLWVLYGFGYAANTLGYIYFNDAPGNTFLDYEKAFHYYSIASVFGITEASIKLAEMFAKGLFVKKDIRHAFELFNKLYNETRFKFENGDYECEFAEVALKFAEMLIEIKDTPFNTVKQLKAYTHLLQAKFALGMRNPGKLQTGDDQMIKRIDELMAPIGKQFKHYKTSCSLEYPSVFHDFVLNHYPCIYSLSAKQLKNNKVKLTVTRVLMRNSDKADKTLMTFPGFDKCVLTDTVSLTAEEVDLFKIDSDDTSSIIFDRIEEGKHLGMPGAQVFLLSGEPVASIRARSYRLTNPGK